MQACPVFEFYGNLTHRYNAVVGPIKVTDEADLQNDKKLLLQAKLHRVHQMPASRELYR